VQKLNLNIDMEEEIKRSYYDNGQLCYETSYVNGKKHGLVKWWKYNGQLEYETPFINGKCHGLERWWHSNGQLKHETLYKNNLECGAIIYFKY